MENLEKIDYTDYHANYFRQQLAFLFRRKNKTQTEIAQEVQIEQRTLSNYKTGRTQPDITSLVKLADYLNVTLDFLVGRNVSIYDFSGYSDEQLMAAKKLSVLNPVNFSRIDAMLDGLILGQTINAFFISLGCPPFAMLNSVQGGAASMP